MPNIFMMFITTGWSKSNTTLNLSEILSHNITCHIHNYVLFTIKNTDLFSSTQNQVHIARLPGSIVATCGKKILPTDKKYLWGDKRLLQLIMKATRRRTLDLVL